MYRRAEQRKKKKGHKILILLTLVAILLGVVYYVLVKYTVSNVYVEGNLHYTKEEIMDMVMDGPLGNNSLYLSFQYQHQGMDKIPFIAAMEVKILSPDTVKIIVYEKSLAGYVEYLGRYMYFDKDGTVVESSTVITEGIPQITGLVFNHVILEQPLPVEDPEIFQLILNVTQILQKYSLCADRIYFSAYKEMTVYFDSVKVSLGKNDLLNEKIMLLPSLLPDLVGKSGTLHLENYNLNTTTISFEQDEK